MTVDFCFAKIYANRKEKSVKIRENNNVSFVPCNMYKKLKFNEKNLGPKNSKN